MFDGALGTPMDKEGIVAGRTRPHPQGDFPGQARLLTSQIRSSDCAIAARQVEQGMGETKAKNSTR